MLFQIDELLRPDDETLVSEKESLLYEIRESLKPPRLTGKHSELVRVRQNYVDTKIALQLEHLPVDELTTSLAFWQYVEALERKYKAKTPTAHATE